MAVSMKLFCVLVLFSLLYKGNCQCSLDDIKVRQTATGSKVLGKQEWRVTISNECAACSQMAITVDCNGYKTVKDVNPKILYPQGNVCMVNTGWPVRKSNPISFTYAWDNPFPFKPVSSTTYCGY